MADVKHCTASPINNFEGFLHIFYCRIKNFTESLTEKLLRQVGWQGRVQNNWNSPHDVRSRIVEFLHKHTRQIFSLLAVGERWFLSLDWGWIGPKNAVGKSLMSWWCVFWQISFFYCYFNWSWSQLKINTYYLLAFCFVGRDIHVSRCIGFRPQTCPKPNPNTSLREDRKYLCLQGFKEITIYNIGNICKLVNIML